MAVPTAQPPTTGASSGQRPPESSLGPRLRKWGAAIGRPLVSVILAIIAGGIVIIITSSGSFGDRFSAAVTAYQYLFSGAFGGAQNISYTLVNVTPLILCGLSVAIGFRAGLFNIGAEGQLAVGAMTAGIIGLKLPTWPGWALVPLMIIGSMVAGGFWGAIVGFLKAWRGAHEVVTTIMLNWIAFYVTDYLIAGPFNAPGQANQTSSMPPQTNLPKISTFYNATLGHILPPIPQPEQYLVDVGFFLAILALVVYWFLMKRTTFGYQTGVVGQNQKAAHYAGISVKRNLVVVMTLAGAFAGLAGSLMLMGQYPYQLIGQVFRTDTTGFDSIGVALLGNLNAGGVFLGAMLFGGLRQGASLMELKANVPGDLVFIIQALILFSIAAQFLPAIRRAFIRRMSANKRLALVAASAPVSTTTIAALPLTTSGAMLVDEPLDDLAEAPPAESELSGPAVTSPGDDEPHSASAREE